MLRARNVDDTYDEAYQDGEHATNKRNTVRSLKRREESHNLARCINMMKPAIWRLRVLLIVRHEAPEAEHQLTFVSRRQRLPT